VEYSSPAKLEEVGYPILGRQPPHLFGGVRRADRRWGCQMVVNHIHPLRVPDRLDPEFLQGAQEMTGSGVNFAPYVLARRDRCPAGVSGEDLLGDGHAHGVVLPPDVAAALS
jgi:hypothetical protein